MTWFWPGHSTFLSSAQDSAMKFERLRSCAGWGCGACGREAAARSARCLRRAAAPPSDRISPMGLARLPVRGMAAAPAAVLAELDAVGRVALRLQRLVVPPLALGAGEGDGNSDSALCHGKGTLRLSEKVIEWPRAR